MDRGFLWEESTNEAIRGAVEPLVPALEVLTHLGDGALLIAIAVLLYWFGAADTRQKRAFVIAVGLAAFALSVGLKGIFEIPRPDLAFAPEAYPGYTFPSAHSMGSTAFYAALAVTMEWGRRRTRYLLAGLVIVTVLLSRVVIGVHYLGDVIVGALLGLGLVGIGIWIREEGLFDPGPMFLLAAAIAVVATLLGSREFLTMILGASFGATLGWYYVKDRPTTNTGAAVLVLGVALLAGILVLRAVSALLNVPAFDDLSDPGAMTAVAVLSVEVVTYAVLTAAMLVVPAVAIRIENHDTVRRLQSRLPFRGREFDAEKTPLADD